jgi:Fic family protein
MVEMREVSTLIEPAHGSGLNERQRDLIAHALNHTESAYTIAWHKQTQKVAYATARADLLDLAERGLLEQQKRGKKFVFIAPADLADRLRAL